MKTRSQSPRPWLAAGALILPLVGCASSAPVQKTSSRATFESSVPAATPRAEAESTRIVAEQEAGVRPGFDAWRLSGDQLCNALIRNTSARVQPTYGGAVVEIYPGSFEERDRIRNAAWELERRIEHLPGQQPELAQGAMSNVCGISQLKALGATAVVTETGDSIKLLITVDDAERGPRVFEAARRIAPIP